MGKIKNAKDLAQEISLTRSYIGLNTENKTEGIPVGYNAIALSTEGKLFAPSVLHARSYKTGDMAHLSLVRPDHMPASNIKVIKSLIHEETDPATWHMKEIVEFMLKHFIMYFGPTLKDVPFPINKEDREYLKKNDPDQLKALDNGSFIPRTTIDLSKLKFSLLAKESRFIHITKKGFDVKFRLPQFGDIITLSTFMKSEFGESDKNFDALLKSLGPEESQKVINNDDVQNDYAEYVSLKIETASNVNLAMLLEEYQGEPVDKTAGLEKALDIIQKDARFDLALSQVLKDRADEIASSFGAPEKVELVNPFTNKTEIRGFQFRLYDIFQAVLISKSDGFTVSVDS